MYNFSGIIYRIWAVCGIMYLLGGVCILFEKPWKNGFKSKNCKIVICMLAFAVCLGSFYTSRVVWPDVTSYTGEFIESYRDSRAAPPLPFTKRYIFWNGEGKRKGFYLDVSSKEEIFPYEFEENHEYKIYYNRLTKIIVMVEIIE